MKRNILFAAMLLLMGTVVQAQVIVKHGEDAQRIDFGQDKLVKMTFSGVRYLNNGVMDTDGGVNFERQSGEVITFDIEEIRVMGFAADFTRIDELKQTGETAIAYDAAEQVVHIVNAEQGGGDIRIFTAEGKLAKQAKGTAISVADLDDGLYIVNYNHELNAKIIKK
ncbi:MAG: T9SS type A sorting domain-containing protein [Bacteroidaceae bacterium]|nr:T9SS type A sorting domain-containing protein [Bacteroidaceae bacterium]